MLRLSLLTPLFLTTAAFSPHRAVRAFTWWVAEMTDALDERKRDIDRTHFHIETISSMMDVVFHCSEMDESIGPEPDIAMVIVNEISQMVAEDRVDIPESIMALRDVDNSLRVKICSALRKRLTSAEKKLQSRIQARTSTLIAISWYEREIHRLQKSIWSMESSSIHHMAGRSAMQLVESLERLRFIIERDAAIRGVVERHRALFEATIKETDKRNILNGREADKRLESVVDRFVRNNNIAEFIPAVLDVYKRSSGYDLVDFERYLFRLANGLRREKSDAATRVLNSENIVLRGFVYKKKTNGFD